VTPSWLRLRPYSSASSATVYMIRGVDIRVERVGVLLEETPMSLQLKTDEEGTE
jgi:hypothetical protein